METVNQPQGNIEQPQDIIPQFITFANHSSEDRKEDEKEKENEEATMDDWGDVDPAGGPAPTAPGSAV